MGWLVIAGILAAALLVCRIVAWLEAVPSVDDLLADDPEPAVDPWADCNHPAGRVCGRCR